MQKIINFMKKIINSMKKAINSMKKHKEVLIGVALVMVFMIGIVGTMSGNNDDYYYSGGDGFSSSTINFDVMLGTSNNSANTYPMDGSMNATVDGFNKIEVDSTLGSTGNTGGLGSFFGSSGSAESAPPQNNSITNEFNGSNSIANEVNFGDKVIYCGSINIKSGDIPKTLDTIRKAVESNGGYITNVDTGNENYGKVTARVPSENFDKLVNDKNLENGNTVRRSISSKDVSLEYSDQQAELETLRIKEERILEYFKSATNIETMLRLETELQAVRSDISSSEKRLRMMDSYVSYSEVNFFVNSRYTQPSEGAPFFERVRYTVEETVHFFKELTIGIILTAIKFIPLVIYGAIFFFVVRAIVRFRRKRKKAKENTLAKEDTEENSND